MLSQITAALLVSCTLVSMPLTAHADDIPDDPYFHEHVEAVEDFLLVGGSEGSDGTDGSPPELGYSDVSPATPAAVPDRCLYQRVVPRPPDGDPLWAGHDPDTGDLWTMLCPNTLEMAEWDHTDQNAIVDMDTSAPYFVSDGVSPDEGAAGVDPSVLIERARAGVQMPRPEPSFGPNAGKLAVKVPVWFSVAQYAPQSRSATAGRYTAVVTAELIQTEWLPGEPEDPAAFPLHMAAPVVCSGSGAPFGAGMNPGTPPCGYTYIWQSLRERTDGLGRWVLQVTSHYRVTFDVTDTETGEVIRSGSDAVDTSSRVLMPIREWHGVLGDPSLPAPVDQPVYPEILPPSSGTPH